jgi:hypothetical protein
MKRKTDVKTKTKKKYLPTEYSMVDDDETKDLITWTGSGDQFTVFNNVDFSRTVLPRYFKHCNWSSFVRQLNSKFNLLFDFFLL